MDTSKYIKKYPQHGMGFESDRYSTKVDKGFGGKTAVSRALIRVTFGNPVEAGIETIVGYFADKVAIMSIENNHDMNQWFKYKCPIPNVVVNGKRKSILTMP